MSFRPLTLPDAVDTKPQRRGVDRRARARPRRRHAADRLRARDRRSRTAPTSSQRYKVKSGDTLVEIAQKFDVSMMTLWWANKLKSKDDLHVGQVLRIPPVSGLVYTVKDTDTLDAVAAEYKVDSAEHRRPQRPRGPDPRRRPGAGPARRQGRPDPDAQAHPAARQQAGFVERRRRRRRRIRAAAGPLHGRPVPLARRGRRQLHQPVLPLRPRGARHRRGLREPRRRGGRRAR